MGPVTPKLRTVRPISRKTFTDQNVARVFAVHVDVGQNTPILIFATNRLDIQIACVQQRQKPKGSLIAESDLGLATASMAQVRLWRVIACEAVLYPFQPKRVSPSKMHICRGTLPQTSIAWAGLLRADAAISARLTAAMLNGANIAGGRNFMQQKVEASAVSVNRTARGSRLLAGHSSFMIAPRVAISVHNKVAQCSVR